MSQLQNMLDKDPLLNFKNDQEFTDYFSDLMDRLNDFWGNPNNQFNRTDDDIGEWVNAHKNAWRLPVNINSYYRRIIHNIAKENNIYSESSNIEGTVDRNSRQIVLFTTPKSE